MFPAYNRIDRIGLTELSLRTTGIAMLHYSKNRKTATGKGRLVKIVLKLKLAYSIWPTYASTQSMFRVWLTGLRFVQVIEIIFKYRERLKILRIVICEYKDLVRFGCWVLMKPFFNRKIASWNIAYTKSLDHRNMTIRITFDVVVCFRLEPHHKFWRVCI